MGACGSGLLEKLGPEFGKLVAAEKGKEFLDLKVKEVKDTVFKQSNGIKQSTLTQVNDQEKVAIEKVRQAVIDIDKQSPGTLDKAAALQRKSKEGLLGVDQIKGQFSSLRQQVETQFSNQENNITSQIETQAQQQKNLIDSQRPKIPIYDQLPEAQRKKVFQEGEKRFADQIKNQQDQIQKQLESSLNVDAFTNQLRSVQSNINVEGITHNADQLIATAKSGLTSTSMFC